MSDFLKNTDIKGMLMALVLAAMLWVGNNTQDNSISLAKLSTQLEIFVVSQRESHTERLTREDKFEERYATVWPRMSEFKSRIQALEVLHPEAPRLNSPWKQ
jgi:hypothetical protein